MREDPTVVGGESEAPFGELVQYTFAGFIGGLVLGAILDRWGAERSGIGQWLVRTLTGEGESLFEGLYALRQRLRKTSATMAEAYGWGKFMGMTVPWWIDACSRWIGIDVYGIAGFYIPYVYAMSDQIGANIAGGIYLYRRYRSLRHMLRAYLIHPVMLASLVVILIVPIGLLLARLWGFSPTTQVKTALETIAANLCWVPPLVGWMHERRAKTST